MPPARTKAIKKIKSSRVVYVSWLEDTNERAKLAWKDKFLLRLDAVAGGLEEIKALVDTGKIPPGDRRKEWLASVFPTVTDFVGVMTDHYLVVNRSSRDEPPERELARALARIHELQKKNDRLRIWLAPVDPPAWRNQIADIWLHDPDGLHRGWLIRLREDRKFTWPGVNPGRSAEEIAEAVDRIIG